MIAPAGFGTALTSMHRSIEATGIRCTPKSRGGALWRSSSLLPHNTAPCVGLWPSLMSAEAAVLPSVKSTATWSALSVSETASHSEAVPHLLFLLRGEHIVSGEHEVHSRVRKLRSQG